MSKEYIRQHEVISQVPSPMEVYLMEDFEDADHWTHLSVGQGHWERKTKAAFMGSYGMHLWTRTTSPAIGDIAAIAQYLGTLRSRYVELSLRYFIPTSDTSEAFEIRFPLLRNGYQADFRIRWNGSTSMWQYWGTDDAWHNITAISGDYVPDRWHQIKLLVDTVDGEFISLDTGAEFADLSSISVKETVAANGEISARLYILVEALAAAVVEVYLDQILVRGVQYKK